MKLDTDAIRKNNFLTVNPDIDTLCDEVDRLTADNKGLITCLKKDVTYKQAIELAKREHEITKLTADNKLMREALAEVTEQKGRFSTDPLTHAQNCICDMAEIAENALTAIKGDPK